MSLCTYLHYSLNAAVHCFITLSGTHNYEQVKFAKHKLIKGKIRILSSISQLCYAILKRGCGAVCFIWLITFHMRTLLLGIGFHLFLFQESRQLKQRDNQDSPLVVIILWIHWMLLSTWEPRLQRASHSQTILISRLITAVWYEVIFFCNCI